MVTYTSNLNLAKPDATEKASPDPFNNNMDILDNEISDLNRYKAMISDTQTMATAAKKSADEATTNVTNLTSTVTGLSTDIGNISTLLDTINGESV